MIEITSLVRCAAPAAVRQARLRPVFVAYHGAVAVFQTIYKQTLQKLMNN